MPGGEDERIAIEFEPDQGHVWPSAYTVARIAAGTCPAIMLPPKGLGSLLRFPNPNSSVARFYRSVGFVDLDEGYVIGYLL